VHQGRFGALSFSPMNHKFVVSGGEDGKLVFVDYETKGVVKELNPNLGPITVTSFIDGIYVTAATSKGVMFVYDLRNTTAPFQTFRDHAALPVSFQKRKKDERHCVLICVCVELMGCSLQKKERRELDFMLLL
jgi:WD40 repeat protein